MVNGSDDVVAGHGDWFYVLGAEDEPDIGEKLLREYLGNRDDDHAVLLRDGQNRKLEGRGLWNHVQDCRLDMECVEVYHHVLSHRNSLRNPDTQN